ncbi:AlpA family phage regulatory protein [Stenotrophomonas sp.]|uniref:helix-turn-helix transcriptional regulator n=1 Tax=Stenotrophomonas sp. TaxID=69392 RepID=UPI0028AF303B|nr:AlpA family phage regulatory protein [Stenotrophomonas sp.]
MRRAYHLVTPPYRALRAYARPLLLCFNHPSQQPPVHRLPSPSIGSLVSTDGAAERIQELLSLDRVRQMTGMGTTYIYGEIKAGCFPRSIRIGRRALWIQSEVQGWVRQQIAQNRPL